MRRAQRLFQIIQILRRSRGAVTAAALGAELEVSRRTVYRDIADLIGQRIPVEGEAGLGYVLAPGYDMPPLMMTPDEIEALVLGAHWVMGRNDKALANAARDAIAKMVEVIPGHMRPYILEPSVGSKPVSPEHEETIDPTILRHAIRDGLMLAIRYRDEIGTETERRLWPVILGYSDTIRMLVAWCELREDFRHFRTDRIMSVDMLGRHGQAPGALRHRWERWRSDQQASRRVRPD